MADIKKLQGPQVSTQGTTQAKGKQQVTSTAKDGLGIATGAQTGIGKDKNKLDKGTLPAPDEIEGSTELAAAMSGVVARMVNTDENNKKVLELTTEALAGQVGRGISLQEIEGDEALLANLSAGSGSFEDSDAAFKRLDEMKRKMERLQEANSRGDSEEHQKTTADMQSQVFSKYVSGQQAADAATTLKMDADPAQNPNAAFITQLAALSGQLIGGGMPQLLRAMASAQTAFTLNQEFQQNKGKGLNAMSMGQMAGQMFGRGGAGKPPAGGGGGGRIGNE